MRAGPLPTENGTAFAVACHDAMTARMCEQLGIAAGYVSGAMLGHSLAVSEALLTAHDLGSVVAGIRARSGLPLLVDAGVGFGDAVHTRRTVWILETAGAQGIELEDQVAPKRVEHHVGIEELLPVDDMCAKIMAAVDARESPDFTIVGRTNAVRNESFASALERAHAYAEAGADLVMLLPETEREFADAPALLPIAAATLSTADRFTPDAWSAMGWRLVVDPLTGPMAATLALHRVYSELARGEAGSLTVEARSAARGVWASTTGLDDLLRGSAARD